MQGRLLLNNGWTQILGKTLNVEVYYDMFKIPETRRAKKPDNFVSPKLSGILRFDFRRLLRQVCTYPILTKIYE